MTTADVLSTFSVSSCPRIACRKAVLLFGVTHAWQARPVSNLCALQPGKERRHDPNNLRPHVSSGTAASARTAGAGPREVDIEMDVERRTAAEAV